jgi:hypothetical protein
MTNAQETVNRTTEETAVPYHPVSFPRGKGKYSKVVSAHTTKAYGGVEV